MISIIICSRKTDIPLEMKDNIASTIGCEYELCVIDNSRNEYNIFTAYNEGVRRAKGDLLCFMHEDILFHSYNWGQILQTAFHANEDLGCIGVIGGQYISRECVPWWESSATKGLVMQGYVNDKGNYQVSTLSLGKVDVLTDVAVVDGCFMVLPVSIFKGVCWSVGNYRGFHMYDMDMCMQILQKGKRVCVIPNITIEHCSLGKKNREYFKELKMFYQKWSDSLPMYVGIDVDENEIAWREGMMKKWLQLYQIRSSHLYQMLKTLFGNWKTIIYNN